MPKLSVKQLPNIITIFRLVLAAVFPFVFFYVTPRAALAVFLLAAATDALDGYIARRFDAVTPFGQAADPLADKLMVVLALICLCVNGLCEPWIAIVMGAKELAMVLGGVLLYKKNTLVQPANIVGKAAAFIFFAAIALSFFGDAIPWSWALRAFAVLLSVFSTMQYGVIILLRLKRGQERSGG